MSDEVGSASVHGVVTHLSPIKKSKKGNNYYHGRLCDGQNTIPFVGFAPSQQMLLKEFRETKKPIEMDNCQVKKSTRDSEKMEVLLKGATKINPSKETFDVSDMEFQDLQGTKITLSELNDIEPLTRISVIVKAVSSEEPITLGTRQKQEIKVCDSTGLATVQLWEENIGILQQGRSYQLDGFRVIEYENEKYITMCWDGSEVKETEELKDVIDLPAAPVPNHAESTIKNARIAAVYKLEKVVKCLRCSSRTEPGTVANQARCCNCQCGILNNTTFCDTFTSVEVLIISENSERIVLSAFSKEIITQLLGSDCELTEEALLCSPLILYLTHKNNEIVKVRR